MENCLCEKVSTGLVIRMVLENRGWWPNLVTEVSFHFSRVRDKHQIRFSIGLKIFIVSLCLCVIKRVIRPGYKLERGGFKGGTGKVFLVYPLKSDVLDHGNTRQTFI